MISVFDRSHTLSFSEDSDEVGLIVESAVIADFRCACGGVGKHVTRLGNPEVVDVCDE